MRRKIEPSRINWRANVAKQEANAQTYRAMAYDIMGRSKVTGGRLKVLSLPAATWQWEQGLADAFQDVRFSFLGLERDPVVHRKARRLADGLRRRYKMPLLPSSFIDFARTARKQVFDIIYLDWMGTWSREKKEDLSAMFGKGMLAPGGLLMVTVSLRRGRPETTDELRDLSYDMPFAFYDARGEDKYTSNLKVRGIPCWIQTLARSQHDIGMRLIMSSVYYSRTGVSYQTQPQLQLLMLRES